MLNVSLLGDFSISLDETPVTDVASPRLQSLLAYLLLHRGAPQSRAHLAYQFWPDTTEAQSRTNLRNVLHHLRRALPDADAFLDATVQTLHWRSDTPLTLDVACFEAALARASRPDDPAAVRQALEQSIALYRGDLLPSCYDDWILPERERLRQAFQTALKGLIQLLEEEQDYEAAIAAAQRLLQHDPLQEAAYRGLIRLHALNGDRAAALRVYHTCTTVLERELEVEPGAATRAAYEQLLGAAGRPSRASPPTVAFSPLVGRTAEWAQLQGIWRSVAGDGGPQAIVVRGEAGIGKTRLAEDLLQWATRQGIAGANARCYAAEGQPAYAPVTAWLRARPLGPLSDVWLAEIGRLLPEVLIGRPDLPRPAALTDAWQRGRFFEALCRAVLAIGRPLLLTIDDLQWSDGETLDWLHFLLHFDPGAQLLIVGTYRPEEVCDDHPLAACLQALRLGEQLTEIELRPLDPAATRFLATRVAGREIDAEAARRLYQETEGNPLFVIETIRAGLPGHGGLPPKVQSVLEARLAQLSPPARELVGLAATIGREFSYRLLAEAGHRDQESLVRELDELWQRRIIRERGADGYDFSHGKLRDVTYGAMSAARRRLCHAHVAEALERLHAGELDPVSHQVAAHYERAALPARAVPYYWRAAEVARHVYANDEAVALLRRGLALCADDGRSVTGEGSDEMAAHLYEGLGDVLELAARHGDALQAYQEARVRVGRADAIWQARLYRKAAAVTREQRLYAETLEACHQAELMLGEPADDEAGPWWAEWLEVQVERVWAHYWLAQWPAMEELVDRVGPVVEELGSAAGRWRFLTAACLMEMRRDRYVVSDRTLTLACQALSAAREWGDLKAISEAQFEIGFLHLWRRELAAAEENLQAALALDETCGAAGIRTIILTYMTVLHRFRGEIELVRICAREAEQAAVAAQMPDYVAAAQGNLAWVAWREGKPAEAEELGWAALSQWQASALVYPFRWIGLWPLVAVALARGQVEEAGGHALALLEPTQQRLPEALNAPLEAAAHADSQGMAGRRLYRATEIARELGYL
ncbi:MAG: BTAD domain-containing putative transcriptional regulator [Anaerolineae bacterium]